MGRRVRIDIDVADIRRRLGLTEQELPDSATDAQLNAAFEGMPQLRSDAHPGLPDDEMVMVEREDWDRITQERRIAASRERDNIIDRAIRRGKFAPSRRNHYAALYDSDPQGAIRQITAMADDVIPVEARGNVGSGEDMLVGGQDAYPTNWLPDLHHQHERMVKAND
jgi:hypothetical protein